ncbi:serine hydrolase domain-containing protein [Opitutus terrae]|uniref:Beta-lactamase n=1 Tax=Opitutus terrae (strain DSM 11246 / JCM 15787 / PB90-1) TaxID=452637 RepID=B1ZWJ7_OPITP|nr:serine hydrolase [Opitutus terrae]ACB73321.1 beta-lactamase [Opitutus terrae PB90-1]
MKLIRILISLFPVAALTGAALAATTSLPRSTPAAEGVSAAAVAKFVEEADAKVDTIHSFMLVRHGKVVAEGWWTPYAANEPHVLYSLSKSFTSTAVGLAVAEGKLSVTDPVLKFFPEDAPAAPSENLKAMRLRDLLTMSTGHHNEDISDFPFYAQENLVKRFLSLPVAHKPGTFFVYNTPATFMQSAIVQKVTGQSVLEYLKPRLFEPLGIENPVWEATAVGGISMGGFGLNLHTEDIAKFGQLYLQKGKWNGKQLIPEAWIAEATARQMSNGSNPDGDWDQGYGYQFWRCRHGFYRGDGAFGQFCIVMPQYDAVVAITSGTRDMGLVMNLVWDHIVPGLKDSALPADAAAEQSLKERLAHLSIATTKGAASSPLAASIAGRRFVFPANGAGIEAIQFEPAGADGTQPVTVWAGGEERQLVVAHGRWNKGVMGDGGNQPGSELVAASGAWTADDTYTTQIVRYRTPLITTYRCRFAGDQVFMDAENNVAFGERKLPQLVGTAEKR